MDCDTNTIENQINLRKREAMVSLLRKKGIRDEKVLRAINNVPRECFVLPQDQRLAYDDSALAIHSGQTISQPYIVALMIQEAELTSDAKVLEVGTGSGYAAAVLSKIAKEVYSVEVFPELSKKAEDMIQSLGYTNVVFKLGDGRLGLKEYSPFDAILVAARSDKIPPALRDQLKLKGHLIIPIGNQLEQVLIKVTRVGIDDFTEEPIEWVRFVPLIDLPHEHRD